MKFTDFYAQPICGPSRAAIMTGCYPMRVLMHTNPNKRLGCPGLHPDEITIAEILKKTGYTTACFGKWHLGHEREYLPRRQGFDYYFGTPKYNGRTKYVDHSDFICELMRNEKVIEKPANQNTLTKRYTEEAIEFIGANKNKPFFIYLAHNFPHVPLHASKQFRGKSRRGLYGDTIEEIDYSTGRIFDALKKLGLDDNTLVVFVSDNGPWVREDIGDHGGSAAPLRGFKCTSWEGGFRVPCIMRWPGRIPPGEVCSEMATTMDFLPTFTKLAGAKVPTDRVIDGKDIMSLMSAEACAESPYEAFYYYAFTQLQAVRSGRWKLILPREANPKWMPAWYSCHMEAIPKPQLYDLKVDMEEKNDLAEEHPNVVARLMKLAEKAREDLGDYNKLGKGVRYFDRPIPSSPAMRNVR